MMRVAILAGDICKLASFELEYNETDSPDSYYSIDVRLSSCVTVFFLMPAGQTRLLPSTTYAVFHQRYGVSLVASHAFRRLTQTVQWIWYATFGARAAADAAITAWTCIFLHKSQNKIQRYDITLLIYCAKGSFIVLTARATLYAP